MLSLRALGVWGVAVPAITIPVPSLGGSSRGIWGFSPITLPTGPHHSPASPGVSRLSPHSMSAIVSRVPPTPREPRCSAPPSPSPGRGCGRGAHSSHWLGTSPPTAAGGSLLKGDTAVVMADSWMGYNAPSPSLSLGWGSLKMACLRPPPAPPGAGRPLAPVLPLTCPETLVSDCALPGLSFSIWKRGAVPSILFFFSSSVIQQNLAQNPRT